MSGERFQDHWSSGFIFTDHGELLYTEAKRERTKEIPERLWAVMVAQHLISQLAMVAVNKKDKNYIIENYAHLSLAEMNNKCPCEKGDPISGEEGDTSFGMWIKYD